MSICKCITVYVPIVPWHVQNIAIFNVRLLLCAYLMVCIYKPRAEAQLKDALRNLDAAGCFLVSTRAQIYSNIMILQLAQYCFVRDSFTALPERVAALHSGPRLEVQNLVVDKVQPALPRQCLIPMMRLRTLP